MTILTRRPASVLFAVAITMLLFPLHGRAQSTFNSGSTGADGEFAPTSNRTLTVPANGIFNFTTISIPSNVTVTFTRNAANTPVVFLAQGNVTIAGVINVSGQSAPESGTRLPIPNYGRGGPGGFDGGPGGRPQTQRMGGAGQGPGGGFGGDAVSTACAGGWSQGGGGAGFGQQGTAGRCNSGSGANPAGGAAYGSSLIQPLVGGSGGGGGAGGALNEHGGGGGGGGGAILIASSTRIDHSGLIYANGGSGGESPLCCASTTINSSASGGGGSGGAIRLVAPVIAGGGRLDVFGGGSGFPSTGGTGAAGRVRVDIVSSGNLNYLNSLPSLTIASVGGIAAPSVPTGEGDIAFPTGSASTQSVVLNTTGVPPGTTVTLTVKPASGLPTVTTSAPLVGTRESATATATIEVPVGSSTVTAVTSYTVSVAMGEALSVYAQNERVERIIVSSDLGASSTVTLVTASGRQVRAPAQALMLTGIDG